MLGKGWEPQGLYGGIAVMGKPVFSLSFGFGKMSEILKSPTKNQKYQVPFLLIFSDVPLPHEILSTNMTLLTWFM